MLREMGLCLEKSPEDHNAASLFLNNVYKMGTGSVVVRQGVTILSRTVSLH